MSLLAEIWQQAGKIDCKRWGLWETSRRGLFGSFCRRGGKNFVAPGDGGGLFQHGGDGAVFFLGQGDGVLHGGFVERAAQAEEDFELGPDGGRLGGAFAGAEDFQRFQLLALFFEDDQHVRGGAGAQRHQHHLHRAGSLVRFAVGIERDRVAGGADGEEFLLAGPLDGGCLHGVLPVVVECSELGCGCWNRVTEEGGGS